MNTAENLQKFGLVPPEHALPQIRDLLAEEAEAERRGRPRREDLALLCCVQLFSRGFREDILRIWDAKQSGFDLHCALDIQFLCGAGLNETKVFLAEQASQEAITALKYLTASENAGDFTNFSPEAYLNQYRQYFGVK